jgi:hypothetical protein
MMANALIRTSLLTVGLAGALLAHSAFADATEGSYVTPGSKAAGLENCVEETGFMRRNHMELIKHQRDATVHSGIRTTKHSLAGCIECHVSYGADKAPVPVNADGQFCIACHEFAAVGMNCFGCHASVPAFPDSQAAAQAARGELDWHVPFAMNSPDAAGVGHEPTGEGIRP